MATSALDKITSTYAAWSVPGWTSQQDVSAAVVTATGGTYEVKAPKVQDKKAK